MKKCIDYEMGGVRPRGRPKKMWSEITEKEILQDAMDCRNCGKWRKLIKDVV